MSTEQLTPVKSASFDAIINGKRSLEFDAFLEEIPTPELLGILIDRINQVREKLIVVKNLIFDIDGTLTAPYKPIPTHIKTILIALKEAGYNIGLSSNRPTEQRILEAKELKIPLHDPEGIPKPDLQNYLKFHRKNNWDPSETIMFGDTPVADKPYLVEITTRNYLKSIRYCLRTIKKSSPRTDGPNKDYHPRRDQEVLAASVLIRSKDLEFLPNILRLIKVLIFKGLIRTEVAAVLAQHPRPINTQDLTKPSSTLATNEPTG